MTELDVKTLFTDSTPHIRLAHGQRSSVRSGDSQRTRDAVDGADCMFFRTDTPTGLRLEGHFLLRRCAAGGWLLRNRDPASPSYWLPVPPMLRRVSQHGHILEERAAEWDGFDLDSTSIEIAFSRIPEGWALDALVWRIADPTLLEELQTLTPIETQGYFLLGTHTRYGKPGDVYRHLVHGWVYEDRFAWPHKRRICSENDAHALHLILSGLQRTTGKRLYGVLKTQLLLSVLSRQGEDGGFRHGEWTDDMESHYRLHCSALHLMMDSLSDADDPVVRAALARGISFISDKRDDTAVGAWFYHDELETSAAGMNKAPFKWWPGNTLGKSPQNMLVLNTQLDTLVALDRYGIVTGDSQYLPLVDSGYQAVAAVLSLRPMEWLYRLLFSAIDLTLLPTERAKRLPLWRRLWKRLGWQVFVPRLPRLKTRYPRLVMPGGYIDRELSLQVWAYDYLAVNLMDLVRAARGAHFAHFAPYIRGVLSCCERTEIPQRWLEQKGRAYSVGFYAEALYLLSLREPGPELDGMLAEALILCVRQRLGLPPSVLGGNAEAQVGGGKTPSPTRADIVVANLSHGDSAACLVVNAGESAIKLEDALSAVPDDWDIPATELPSGGWCRIEA
jgi:hypothetical protein